MPIATDKLVDSKDIANAIQDILNQLDTKVSNTGNETIDGIKTFNDTIKVKNLQVTNSGKSVTPADNSNSTDIATTAWVLKALGEYGLFSEAKPTNSKCWYWKLKNGIMIQWGIVPVTSSTSQPMSFTFVPFRDLNSYVIFKNYESGKRTQAKDDETSIVRLAGNQAQTRNNYNDLANHSSSPARSFQWFAIGLPKNI